MCENYTGEKEVVGLTHGMGKKRHLPPWMLGVADAVRVNESDNGDGNKYERDNMTLSQTCNSKANTGVTLPRKADIIHTRETLGTNCCSLAKCEMKRKRKSSQQDAHGDGNIPYKKKKKNNVLGIKVRKSFARKRKNEMDSGSANCEEFLVHPLSDDDMDLKMEEMMAIAEEYVKADKNMKQEKASDRGPENRYPARNPCRIELGDAPDAPVNEKISTFPATAVLYSSVGKVVSNNNASQTGDPAQDMLGLFLGPLLKKPLDEDKYKCMTEDLTIAYKFNCQNEDNVVGEQMVPLAKKKSSLKGKVAMLLD
ncbi:Serine/threonine-protein kinase dhkG [Quillaja saponaria]|uniref:Serine/threonine-protein kinase dhkG n=1 Tax=Quillaja saponaria TaxID=32244 RepID=A0AAD7KMU1_QUISA|nr:Serine/threonine-protein kinase dhkG [Quillaja saponaria]